MDLGEEKSLTGVMTQGRQDESQWVTQYKLSVSVDGIHFFWIANLGFSTERHDAEVFAGNFDRNTIVENTLPQPVVVRFVRLNPVEFNNRISVRWELLTCDVGKTACKF